MSNESGHISTGFSAQDVTGYKNSFVSTAFSSTDLTREVFTFKPLQVVGRILFCSYMTEGSNIFLTG